MNDWIQEMIDWIEAHLFEDFSLLRLSEKMGYSPYYCSFKFRHHTGVSIKSYRTLRRLFLASILLAETHERILDIAIEHGYSSQEAFARAFKEVFGVTPMVFRKHPKPWQSYFKLNIEQGEDITMLDISQKLVITELQNQLTAFADQDILNVLNGQVMYEQFRTQELMGQSDYVPFNEAMCVHAATGDIFSPSFNQVRAEGHHSSVTGYEKVVIEPLEHLFTHSYRCIVLWFGEDMFCQINLLTILSYLEQSGYDGIVYFNAVQEQTYDVQQTEITLGGYTSLYREVILEKKMPDSPLMPVMYQGVSLYLDLHQADNELTRYIASHPKESKEEVMQTMLKLFQRYGLGDRQYLELIEKVRGEV
ncbi:helix-turn-helix domain-containing protein [Paenibacillus sp. PK4536]|uniref:helix-turn-helix transcriptional regulator n=1 Tax=Paenibacillus sp. PK4536 TaxID=3024576 RepID=UPI002358F537|nr:helix-turn-helix domain-containing protein [Paenibacillus sp. PK4536]WIM41285.1 helix-turn-helix domain-containing protein [Paenibacillus sp. PK4536]